MEILLGILGLGFTVVGLLIALFSRTDQLLAEIRNLLIQIRDK